MVYWPTYQQLPRFNNPLIHISDELKQRKCIEAFTYIFEVLKLKTNYFILLVLIVSIDVMAGIELNVKDMKQASSEETNLESLAKKILTMATMGNTGSPKLKHSTETFSSIWYQVKKITRIDTIESENFRLEFSSKKRLPKSEPEPEPASESESESEWLTHATLENLTIPGLHIRYYDSHPSSIYTCSNNKYKDFRFSDKSWKKVKNQSNIVIKDPDDSSIHYSMRPNPIYIEDKKVTSEYENKIHEWLKNNYKPLRPSTLRRIINWCLNKTRH